MVPNYCLPRNLFKNGSSKNFIFVSLVPPFSVQLNASSLAILHKRTQRLIQNIYGCVTTDNISPRFSTNFIQFERSQRLHVSVHKFGLNEFLEKTPLFQPLAYFIHELVRL